MHIRDCKVCVVGGAGFLGSHVAKALQGRGCEVLAVDDLSVGQERFLPPGCSLLRLDISAEDAPEHLYVELSDCSFAFNYAAVPYIPDVIADPTRAFRVNALGALHAVEACRALGVPLLQVSSAEVYGDVGDRVHMTNRDWRVNGGKLQESCRLSAHSTYAASKVAADLLVRTRAREAGAKCVALRQFNCCGARETHPYVVPELITQVLAKDHSGTVRLGNDTYRDFMHAADAAELAVQLLEAACAGRAAWGEAYNLGSQDSVSVYALAAEVAAAAGVAPPRVERDHARCRDWDVWHLMSDNSALFMALGRAPRLRPRRDALADAVAWYRGEGCRWPWETGSEPRGPQRA